MTPSFTNVETGSKKKKKLLFRVLQLFLDWAKSLTLSSVHCLLFLNKALHVKAGHTPPRI